MADPVFRAGGIISGFDTNSIIEQLARLKRKPLDDLRTLQSGYKTQISLIADITSKLKTLKSAVKTLGDSGALGVKVTSTNTAFSAEASTSSVAGRYDVTVGSLASAARAQSVAYASTDTVKEGTLTLTLDGTAYNVTIANGDSLQTVAANINATGAPLSAVVLNDGVSDYLSIVNRDTGYTIGGAASSALQVSESYTGASGVQLGLSVTDATNASLTVNGLTFTRRSNVVTDAVPGTTLTLKSISAASESLTQENDVATTSTNLQKFVTAYNDVVNLLHKQLDISAKTDRNSTLAGDSAVRRLNMSLGSIVSSQVSGLANVRSLVDLGIKSSTDDGTLSIDNSVLTRTVSRSASSINALFSTATSGISDQVKTLVNANTNVVDGIFTIRTKGINSSIRTLDDKARVMEARVEAYKTSLVIQFANMEKVIAGLKTAGSYLNQPTAAGSSGSNQ